MREGSNCGVLPLNCIDPSLHFALSTAMEAGWRALDISLRAIDAYKKTLLVDKVTSDDEMPAPVYTLDEISNILMSCSLDLTKEIVEYTLRRLRHRSPQVKKKVLRFIQYTVNNAGSSSYRRELQSCSLAIRELVNYQGQADPLKGHAPNQAVRDAAQEAIKAIFSSDVSIKGKNIQIEGFGSGSFAKSSTTPYRTSSLNEMESDSLYGRTGSGSFDYRDRNGSFVSMNYKQGDVEEEGFHHRNGADCFDAPDFEQDREGAMWNVELPRPSQGRNVCKQSKKVVSPEDRLLNNITTSVGLRRPTEESLQSFLSSAKTLDAAKIGGALKAKLRSSSWQVRLKAACVLEAILRQKDANLLQVIEADERDFDGYLQECLKSPEATLRKEAKQALKMLCALNDPVIDPSCDKPFFTTEADKDSIQAPPAAKSDHELVDLLSFHPTCDQGADTSPNSVMGDPFDGMHIYGSNAAAASHAKDLLSDGWDVSARMESPFKSWLDVQSATISSTRDSALQESQCKADLLGFDSVYDFTINMPNATVQCAASSLGGKTSQAGLLNLDALYMYQNGAMGSLHTNT